MEFQWREARETIRMIKLDIINEVVNRTGITKTKAEMATLLDERKQVRARIEKLLGQMDSL